MLYVCVDQAKEMGRVRKTERTEREEARRVGCDGNVRKGGRMRRDSRIRWWRSVSCRPTYWTMSKVRLFLSRTVSAWREAWKEGVGNEGGEHVDEDVARDVDVGEEDLVERLKKLESRELSPSSSSSSSSSSPSRRSMGWCCCCISRKETGVYLADSHIALLIDGPVDSFDWAGDIALWGSS